MSAWGQNSEERLSAQFLLEPPPPSHQNFFLSSKLFESGWQRTCLKALSYETHAVVTMQSLLINCSL